jgi:hypothetical protein
VCRGAVVLWGLLLVLTCRSLYRLKTQRHRTKALWTDYIFFLPTYDSVVRNCACVPAQGSLPSFMSRHHHHRHHHHRHHHHRHHHHRHHHHQQQQQLAAAARSSNRRRPYHHPPALLPQAFLRIHDTLFPQKVVCQIFLAIYSISCSGVDRLVCP